MFSVIQDQQSRELSQGKTAKRAKQLKIEQEELKLPPVRDVAACQVDNLAPVNVEEKIPLYEQLQTSNAELMQILCDHDRGKLLLWERGRLLLIVFLKLANCPKTSPVAVSSRSPNHASLCR